MGQHWDVKSKTKKTFRKYLHKCEETETVFNKVLLTDVEIGHSVVDAQYEIFIDISRQLSK